MAKTHNIKRRKIHKIGSKFGKWTIIDEQIIVQLGLMWQKVQCECGHKQLCRTRDLRFGKSKGCKSCASSVSNFKHGFRYTKEYRTWRGLRDRCSNPKSKDYPKYGGRGIDYDPRWDKFENFINDMGRKPSPELQLDRIDNDKGYYKENCRWVTAKENFNNRKRKAISECRNTNTLK